MKEKKARVEDALNATGAAVEEGIVVGGGVALVRCLDALDKVKVSEEEKNGINLLKRAIGEPLKHIAVNAGHEGSVVLRKVMDGKDDYGFNAEKACSSVYYKQYRQRYLGRRPAAMQLGGLAHGIDFCGCRRFEHAKSGSVHDGP
jgi:hypothetical protein